jgi:hypothetical protein
VEHAAKLTVDYAKEEFEKLAEGDEIPKSVERAMQAEAINFQKLFLLQEVGDDESSSLADVLEAMVAQWPDQFTAIDVAKVVNNIIDDDLRTLLREFLFKGQQPPTRVSPKSMGRLLRRHVDAPVWSGDRMLALRVGEKKVDGAIQYHIQIIQIAQPQDAGAA